MASPALWYVMVVPAVLLVGAAALFVFFAGILSLLALSRNRAGFRDPVDHKPGLQIQTGVPRRRACKPSPLRQRSEHPLITYASSSSVKEIRHAFSFGLLCHCLQAAGLPISRVTLWSC